jgi:hypothetical protein
MAKAERGELVNLAVLWLAVAGLGGWALWYYSSRASLGEHPCAHHGFAADRALTHYAMTGCPHCGAHFG